MSVSNVSSQEYLQSASPSVSKNLGKLVEFLEECRGPNNDNSGKYNVPLKKVRRLFDDTWKNLSTRSGHVKLKHSITGVVINYKNHDNDPVDAGAIVTLADAIQTHINSLHQKSLDSSANTKNQPKLNGKKNIKPLKV